MEDINNLEDLEITSMVDDKVEVARLLVEKMATCSLKF